MTKAAKVLLLKYAMTFILAVTTVKLLDGNSWLLVLALSVTLATIHYLIGDYYILRRYGNWVASLVNGFLAAMGTYFVSALFEAFEARLSTIALFAFLIFIAEYYFHKQLMVSPETRP